INKAYSQTASTLTFIDYDTGKFASTAHVVEFSKEDEEALKIPNISKLSEGIVFNAKVIGKKSDGLETESISRIGKITSNNDFGVYGIIDNTYLNNLPRFKVAPVSQIVNGEAYILSSVEGEIKKYPITITGVDLKNMSSIQFTVNDDYLKSIGNLLHGMSGSPIIQNDKIIGAVARMNTKTMECYGTLAEIMMKNLEQIK
ncbi:MAG: SpoIVB peptidase S55 domain-containing protein, partial [Oscillospiraceae bacterium]